LYERTLRVPEYFLFDPTGDYLRPSACKAFGWTRAARTSPSRSWTTGCTASNSTSTWYWKATPCACGTRFAKRFYSRRRNTPPAPTLRLPAPKPKRSEARAQAAEAELARLRARLAALEVGSTNGS
jgi:hypothetical protein